VLEIESEERKKGETTFFPHFPGEKGPNHSQETNHGMAKTLKGREKKGKKR